MIIFLLKGGWPMKRGELVAAEESMAMLRDLCTIAGYGIHSGIHPGPKADEVAQYILKKL